MFGKNKTLESQVKAQNLILAAVAAALGIDLTQEQTAESFSAALTAIVTARDTAQGQVTTLTTERDALSGQVSSLTGERDALSGQVTTLTGERDASRTSLETFSSTLRASLEIAPAADGTFPPLTAESIAAAVDLKAGAKAIQIAAGQGVPPVLTNPKQPGAPDDPVAAAFAAARAETDPVKRALLFKKASQLVNSQRGAGNN